MAAAIDDSCRRPGSIPFKWEICPGTPKHVRSSSATIVPSSYSSTPPSKMAVAPKLTPPPSMSPSPYHSQRASYSARSASVSPSRRRPQHRPTAFLDVTPRAAPAPARAAAAYGGAGAEDDEATAAAYRCFPLPVFRRRDGNKKGGGGLSGRRSAASSSSGSSFRSVDGAPALYGGQLRRSASSSSSSCLSLSSGSSSKFAEPREVEAATGWFF